MNEFNNTLRKECALAHGFYFEKIMGFQFDSNGDRLDVYKYLPDGCHPRDSGVGFFKYRRELRNIVQRAKPRLAEVMYREGRLCFHY